MVHNKFGRKEGKESIVPLGRALGLLVTRRDERLTHIKTLREFIHFVLCVQVALCVRLSLNHHLLHLFPFLFSLCSLLSSFQRGEQSGHQFPSPSRLTQLMMLVIGGRKRRQ